MTGIDITCITRINRNTSSPRLAFHGKWLGAMGFLPGALVQFVPELGGMTFTLCDENIQKYSELDRQTKEQGGILMQVYEYRDGLQLCISGARLDATGLIFGDALLIRYEPGFVHMRRLPGMAKLVTPHVVGQWLAESGFVPNAVLTMASEPGLITCTLHENGLERTAELVKYARANKLKLIQVQKEKYKHGVIQWIDIPPPCLEKAGFTPDDALLAVYEYGLIKLQKPDFVSLGF